MTKLLAKSNSTSKLAFAGFAMGFLAEKDIFTVIINVLKGTFIDLFLPIIEIFASLLLIVYNWVLTVVDFAFVLIRQMGGLNTDFSSFDSIVESDLIFKFMFNDNVTEIIKGLFILAVVVILVFGIIAIIKSEFAAVVDSKNTGEIKNDKKAIWKRIAESLLLLVLVPVVLIGSIILSNAVLQTLINATTVRDNMSIGSQIFVAGTYDANAYRIYADANKKIPITYNFNQINDYTAVTDWDTSGTVKEIASALEKYKQATEWTQGYATFEMFSTDAFLNMDTIDYYVRNDGENAYQQAYDKGLTTYKYEYYVNADLQDYLMKYNQRIHMLTAEEVYKSCQEVGIQLKMAPSTYNGLESYTFMVKYADDQEAIEYHHIKGKTDEANGAVFLMCIQKEIVLEDGKTKYYFEPITANNSRFKSHYLADGNQYVVAKGFFDSGKYPTAIKKENGVVKCYRDRLNVPTFGSFFPHISYELPEGSTEELGIRVLKSAVQMFTGINPDDFLPYVYFDFDFMNLFSKSPVTICSLDGGQYYLDYSFTSPGMDIEFIYSKINVNFIILIVAAALIVGKVVKAFFGMFKRSVDIMFLYLAYPAAIATIPLYEKSNFGTWVKQMTSKVLSLYGLLIGINLVILLIPISMEIELFTPFDLQNTILGAIPHASARYLNILFQILFTVVGISFIFDAGSIIQEFVGKGSDIIAEGGKLTESVSKTYKKAGQVVSGEALIHSVKNITGYRDESGQYHAGWIPGSAFINMKDNVSETAHGYQKNRELTNEKIEQNKQEIQKELQKAKEEKEAKKAEKENKKAAKEASKASK